MSTQTFSRDMCCICLAQVAPRGGGQFLVTPGCCGNWFHQTCMEDLLAAGKNECPVCRTILPSQGVAPVTPAVPLPVSSISAPPAPARWGWPNMFSNSRNNNVHVPNPPRVSPRVSPPSVPSNWLSEQPLPPSAPPTETVPLTTSREDAPKVESIPMLSIATEYSETSIVAVSPFNAVVNTSFTDISAAAVDKTALDVVCILDVSGSMDGGKIENLKNAMKFVTGVLSEKDRLSIVTFNSTARVCQGLKIMNAANKVNTNNAIDALRAGGGTDIYSGMASGWKVLKERTTMNSASVVFLLTDGQDPSRLEEKKRLANEIRSAGSALFLFGFGADHDSEHMNQIANAAEGSFVYIETDDTVIDAFGAAIGTQQGAILRNVEILINVTSAGVLIDTVRSGKYDSAVSVDKKSATIRYRDLYSGEQRDCLVALTLPAISVPADAFPLISCICRYSMAGDESLRKVTAPVEGTVKRVTDQEILTMVHRARNIDVDVHIIRFHTTDALQSAITAADTENYAKARDILVQARALVITSASYATGHVVAAQLVSELDDAIKNMSNRETYRHRGGKALTEECSNNYSAQRVVYAKKASAYQSPSAMVQQSNALASKSLSKW